MKPLWFALPFYWSRARTWNGTPPRSPFPSALKATALAISLLVGGAAPGWNRLGRRSFDPVDRDGLGRDGERPYGPRRASGTVPGEAEARRRLRALEASFKGRIGAYALDTATGKTVTYRSGERFPLLSTFKASAAAAVCARPARRIRVRWTGSSTGSRAR